MESDLVNRGLRDLAHCVDFNADPGYFTPQELLTTLEVWLKNMVSVELLTATTLSNDWSNDWVLNVYHCVYLMTGCSM